MAQSMAQLGSPGIPSTTEYPSASMVMPAIDSATCCASASSSVSAAAGRASCVRAAKAGACIALRMETTSASGLSRVQAAYTDSMVSTL